MKKIIGVLVVVFIFGLGGWLYMGYESTKNFAEKNATPIKEALNFMNKMSATWSLSTFEEYFSKGEIAEDLTYYEEVIAKGKLLGEFQECADMTVHDVEDPGYENAVAFMGTCEFTNGSAPIMIAVKPNDNGYEVYYFGFD